MKKILIILLPLLLLCSCCYAEDISTDQMLQEQQDSFQISTFLKEAKQYTSEEFQDLDMKELLNSAIKGEIDNSNLAKKIIGLFGKEVKQSVTVLRQCTCHYCYS